MATPEELEALANSLLADVATLGREVQGLGEEAIEAKAEIAQAGADLQAEIDAWEDACEALVEEADSALQSMFEMVQALGSGAAEAYTGEIGALQQSVAQMREALERSLVDVGRVLEENLAATETASEELRALVTQAMEDGARLAEDGVQTLQSMRAAVDAGQTAADQRLEEQAARNQDWQAAVQAHRDQLQQHVDSSLLPAIESALDELSTQVRDTSEQVVVAGIEAIREQALEMLDQGVQAVVDNAVSELLRLMNGLGDEILDKSEGPRLETEVLREVVDLLRDLVEPLVDRIGGVRGLAASVGVSV
ncbi:MAG: hypothetical protein IT479_06785 [Xanthomonadales bacterium]|nr:hypothetical protein [Xanthomonadales bacterium]MCC6592966.1 hypothetical protein [Xanthomonadales bacterium]